MGADNVSPAGGVENHSSAMGERQVRAVLFDKDGVLVDSMAMIRAAWVAWAARRGLDPEEVLASIHTTAFELLDRFAPDADPAVELRFIAERQAAFAPSIHAFEGAAELLAALPLGAWAIVTSGRREPATRHLRAAGLPVPSVVVAAEDTPRGKPDPSGYVLAARRLGVDPRECIVVEDAPAGIRAGHDAGAFVLAVATTHAVRDLAEADAIVASLRTVEMRPSPGGGLDVRWAAVSAPAGPSAAPG